MREQGGTMTLKDSFVPVKTDTYESAPTIPLRLLGKGNAHQLRAVSPMTQARFSSRKNGAERFITGEQ